MIDFARDVVGVPLLPWQRWLAIHALELLPDRTFRFRTVVLLVARQNGKSTFLQVLALFFLYVRGVPLVIGTAQNLDIAEEVWRGAVDIARDVPELAAEITQVVEVNGKKALVLAGRQRYKVQAANRRGGRGLAGDLVMLDELREHQTWAAWSAVSKTTMARPLAMVWAVSNAGDASSVVLAHLRVIAHMALGNPDGLEFPPDAAPEDVDLDDGDESPGIFEWSAEPGCSVRDPVGQAQANPSLGNTITQRAIDSAVRTDPEAVLRTEVLCQWVDRLVPSVIDPQVWEAAGDPDYGPLTPVAFGLTVAPDRSHTWIGVAGRRRDGLVQVEVAAEGPGVDWAADWLVERAESWDPCAVVLDGTAKALAQPLLAAKVDPVLTTTPDRVQATVGLYDALGAGQLRHTGDPALAEAARTATRRHLGDGWVWEGEPVGPLVAVGLARYGLIAFGSKRPPPPPESIPTTDHFQSRSVATAGF